MKSRRAKLVYIALFICSILHGNAFGGFFNQEQPPQEFLKHNLRYIYHGMGDGGTESTGVTLEEFVEFGLKTKGKWDKSSNSEWIYRIVDIDQVTNKKSKLALIFTRIEEGQLSEFFKNDVILTRINVDGTNLQPKEIWMLAGSISQSIYPEVQAKKKQFISDSNVDKKNAVDKDINNKQKIGEVNSQLIENLLSLKGEVTNVSPIEGSGGFWSFFFKNDGSEFEFQCSASSELYIRDGERDIDTNTGYERLQKLPKNVTLFFSKDEEESIRTCVNKGGCDYIDCPKVIIVK